MNQERLVNETVSVLVRVTPGGEVSPTSFIWRDRTRYVDTIGRQWEERVDGRLLRCYLVQAVDGATYELRWNPDGNQWLLHRAWLRAALA